MNNISYIWVPKWVSPFGDDEVYLVPGVKEQQGKNINYIIVCCSPSYNGVYKCNTEYYKDFATWKNNKKNCYYVPLSKCEFVKTLNDISNSEVIKQIKKVQQAWKSYNKPKKIPDWFLK